MTRTERRPEAGHVAAGLLVLVIGLIPGAALAQEADSAAVSRELREMYEADQADRRGMQAATQDDWRRVARRDSIRRERVLELVRSDVLATGDDFYHAAMVLQHGNAAEDALLAHVLATVAAFRGHDRGPWLSAAALDRYLHRLDQPQILGTQYRRPPEPGSTWTQEPYLRWLPDSIRAEFDVRTAAEQQEYVDRLNGSSPPGGR